MYSSSFAIQSLLDWISFLFGKPAYYTADKCHTITVPKSPSPKTESSPCQNFLIIYTKTCVSAITEKPGVYIFNQKTEKPGVIRVVDDQLIAAHLM